MMYRVLLLQGGQIYCCTLLPPEIGMETFFKEGGVSDPFKKSKKRRNNEYLKGTATKRSSTQRLRH